MCESDFLLLLFFLVTIVRTWVGQTQLQETLKKKKKKKIALLNILIFTEKATQIPLEQESSFPSLLMVKCPLSSPWSGIKSKY